MEVFCWNAWENVVCLAWDGGGRQCLFYKEEGQNFGRKVSTSENIVLTIKQYNFLHERFSFDFEFSNGMTIFNLL